MIVDFQHHFTPRELIKEDPGNRRVLVYDENGAPSYTIHSLLYNLDEHVAMMDAAGIDAAFLTTARAVEWYSDESGTDGAAAVASAAACGACSTAARR